MHPFLASLAVGLHLAGSAAFAQDMKQPDPVPLPAAEEDKAFLEEIESIYRKYPHAAERYKLTDLGLLDLAQPRANCDLICEWDRQWGGWCFDRCEGEREE